MTDAFITTAQIKVFNQNIFSIITDLKRNMRADIKDIHSEIIKTFDFKDTTKEYLQDKNQYAHNQQENKFKKTGIWTLTQLLMTQKRYITLFYIFIHQLLNTPVNDIATSTVPFSTSKIPTTSSNKSGTFNPITPILDFIITFASPKKDTDNFLKKSSNINADSYIDSAYEKSQILRFKSEFL